MIKDATVLLSQSHLKQIFYIAQHTVPIHLLRNQR